MPEIFGIPLIGFIQIVLGAAIIIFIAVKFMKRPAKNRPGEYIIRDVHIIVGDGTELYHRNVYIKDGIIRTISSEDIKIKNAAVLDGKGKTLMPGLIDSHVHIQGLQSENEEDSDRFLTETIPEIFSERVLPYGITTVKDLDAPKHFIVKLRDRLRSGDITGPELLIVGPNFTAPGGHPASTLGGENPWLREELAVEVSSSDEVSRGIDELKEMGVDFLKMTYQGGDYLYYGQNIEIAKLDKSLMKQIIREGREKGLKTTAHAFYKEDVRELLEAGIYGVENGILDEALAPDDPIISLWKESGAHFVPTVNAMTYEKDPERLKNSIHNLKILYNAGIPVAMGTDNMLEAMSGETEHRELEYYVEAGLTPMQAIVAATKGSAEHLGIADRKGTVSEGKEADLILLCKNPLDDISYTRFIDKVFLKGKIVYSASELRSYEIPDYFFPERAGVLTYVSDDGRTERVLYTDKLRSERKLTHITRIDREQFTIEEFTAEPNLSVNSWKFRRPSDDTELTAVRENGVIRLKGKFKGKAQDKNLNIGDGLWYQLMDEAMPAFIKSGHEEILFYSIGTGDNPGAMGLGEFAARKLGEESVTVDDKTYRCVKVSFVLTMFSWAWTGLYWYDAETGILIQSGEKKGLDAVVKSRINNAPNQ